MVLYVVVKRNLGFDYFPIFTNLLKNILKIVFDLAKYTKELEKLLPPSGKILLICHINPDGDAVGSQLALYHFFKAKGHDVEMMSPNNLQEFLKWMAGAENIHIFIRERKNCIKLIKEAKLLIMLDFNQSSRLGEAEKHVSASDAKKVLIDHHLEPQNFTDLIISDPSQCSTAEIVYEIVKQMNGGSFHNAQFAESLYVGIITDTGNFEHGTYTGRTLRIVAELLDMGIDKDKIYDLVYNNFSVDRMRLMGFALSQRMVVLPEYNSAYIYLTKEDLNNFNHNKGDTEGFVNLPLSIKNIFFSTLFVEKDNFVKLSFRSKGKFPVNEFASRYFYGGGHLNASGGEYYDTLDNTIEYFKKVLKDIAWQINE